MSDAPFALYNPALLPPELLLAEFTARRRLLGTVLEIIRGNKKGHPPQHLLFIGPRGMGKTTLLWAIAHTIKLREPELAREWEPIVFDEESRRVGDLADFWLECLRQWEYATKDRRERAERLLDHPGTDLEERAREAFLRVVEESGKRALLLIDNLNEVFASIHDPEPLRRLRAFLMENGDVMVAGCATRWFEDVTALDRPFFEFFRSFELKALTFEEMTECLSALAEARKDENVRKALMERPRTLEALHLLTGGNPRLVKTLYRLLDEGLSNDLRRDLENLLDAFTPYFKAIVDALPGQQQRVFDALALAWNPTEVAAISRATRLPSNQVSAQIRALVKAGLVAEAAGSLKKKSYLLADRFSNIHYLMRHGRAARSRFDWFVSMVRLLFRDEEYAERVAGVVRMSATYGEDGKRDAETLAESAWDYAGTIEAKRYLLDRIAGAPEFDDHVDTKIAEKLCRKAIEENPNDAYAHYKWGRVLGLHLGRSADAETACRKAIELGPRFAPAWNNLGAALSDLGRQEEAETAYRKAIELAPMDVYPWNNLGFVLRGFGRKEEAETVIRKAIEIDPTYVHAWENLGAVLGELGKQPEAETAFRKAIELDSTSGYAWNGLGVVLNDLGRQEEAETAYRRAIEFDPNYVFYTANLVDLLLTQNRNLAEAKTLATRALLGDPASGWVCHNFRRACFTSPEALREVLPKLSVWCGSHPEESRAFEIAIDAWLQIARVTTPRGATALLKTVPDTTPFESLCDTFLAHGDREHLNRLAPERRMLAMNLLERLSSRATLPTRQGSSV